MNKYIAKEINDKNSQDSILREYRYQLNDKKKQINNYKKLLTVLAIITTCGVTNEGLKYYSGKNSIINRFNNIMEENGYILYPHSDGLVIVQDDSFVEPSSDSMLNIKIDEIINLSKDYGMNDAEIDIALRSYEVFDNTLDSSFIDRYNMSMTEYYKNKTKELTK